MSKGAQIAIAAFTVLLGGAWLLAASAPGEGTFAYYENVASYRSASQDGDLGRGIRVHGFVVQGSIRKNLPEGHIDFAIADAGSPEPMGVRYLGIDIPDLFADGAEVVVEGEARDGLFYAERVMAKCPSKYEAEEAEA